MAINSKQCDRLLLSLIEVRAILVERSICPRNDTVPSLEGRPWTRMSLNKNTTRDSVCEPSAPNSFGISARNCRRLSSAMNTGASRNI